MSRSLSGLRRIIRYLRDNEVDTGKKLLFFVPIIYLLFPFDLIVDYIPILGQLDDLAVFIFFWPILKKLLNNHTDRTGSAGKNKKRYKGAIDIDKDDYNIE